MKKVLISDSHPLFRDFLKQKLTDNLIDIILTQENRDIYTKMISNLPNLIILDMKEDGSDQLEFLEKKVQDSNSANIPVIITGPVQNKSFIASLAKYGVIKYFAKPIQFDIFFEAIGRVLHIPLSMDTTPCVLDLHRNGNIIFIEIAKGLNREKLALLQFRLAEMIEKEEIDTPKVIIMLTALDLSFVDGYNLEFLIDNVLACPKVHNKNVKILSLSPYVKELLDGHSNYNEIEMTSNLAQVMASLVDTSPTASVSDLITDKILTLTNETEMEDTSVATRFSSDAVNSDLATKNDGTVLKMAIIDSSRETLKQTMVSFASVGAECTGFTGGQEFLNSFKENNNYDLIILDVLLEDQTGISLLKKLHDDGNKIPIIIYSNSVPKDVLIKVLSLGPRTYLIKPLKPNVLVRKCLNYLQTKY